MANERRFLAGFRETDTDEPGLIQENDGTVWLVNPDGTRTQLPGAGAAAPDVCFLALADNQGVYGLGGSITWDTIVLDTAGFMGDPEDPAGTPVIPEGYDGIYVLETVVYVTDDPLFTRLAGLIGEPSNSADFRFQQGHLSSADDWLGICCVTRPLLAGDEIEVFVGPGVGDGVNTVQGTGSLNLTWFTITRIGALPDGWVRPYG